MRRLLFLLLLTLLGQPGLADRRTSLDQAVSEAREQYGGQVISAQKRRSNGRESYDVRILDPGGQVRRLRIDPDSGQRMPRRNR